MKLPMSNWVESREMCISLEEERERDGISGGGRGKVRKKENGGGMWASELIRGTN